MSKGNGARPGPLARAVAAELRAELAKQGKSVRMLDSILTSHGYVQARFKMNPTQSLDYTDIEAVCKFLNLDELVLLQRAKQTLRDQASE